MSVFTFSFWGGGGGRLLEQLRIQKNALEAPRAFIHEGAFIKIGCKFHVVVLRFPFFGRGWDVHSKEDRIEKNKFEGGGGEGGVYIVYFFFTRGHSYAVLVKILEGLSTADARIKVKTKSVISSLLASSQISFSVTNSNKLHICALSIKSSGDFGTSS